MRMPNLRSTATRTQCTQFENLIRPKKELFMETHSGIRLLLMAGMILVLSTIAQPVLAEDSTDAHELKRVIETQQKQLDALQKQLEEQGKLIQQLLAVEARPQALAQIRLTQLQAQQAAFLDINTRLGSLRTAASSFRTENTFSSAAATSWAERSRGRRLPSPR